MKAEMILKLLDAGYSKTDIDLMEELQPVQPVITEPAPEEPAQPEAPAEPAPAEPEDNTRVNETLTQLLSVVGNLQKTVDAMQKNNAKNAESAAPEKLTTENALRSFFGEKKKA